MKQAVILDFNSLDFFFCFTYILFPLFKNVWILIRVYFPVLAKLLLILEKQMNLQIAVTIIRENFSESGSQLSYWCSPSDETTSSYYIH